MQISTSTVLSLCSVIYFVDGADREKIVKTPSPTSSPVRSTDFDIVPNIYGGTNAVIGEFPYFAEFSNCGGTLIAPDIALTAAHCGDQTNTDIYIGAFKTRSTNYGAQRRTCAAWIMHPGYSTASGLINDVAVCKLSEPVTVDESDVRLVLNRKDIDSFPIIGKSLVAMGFGLLGDVYDTPTFLKRTTLEGRACGEYSSPNQVCAGGPGGADGETDVCRGDSGGPLVKIDPQSSGPDIHYHVGLVSSGALCPAALTGTYARTSAMAPWIDDAMCQLNSVDAVDCGDDVEECEGDESTLEVDVVTDNYAEESTWTLKKHKRGKKWVEVTKNSLDFSNWSYKTVLCLKPESLYEWTLTDSFGDGLCSMYGCGSYSVTLNGEEIVSDGAFGEKVSKRFRTPSGDADPDGCEDEPGKHSVETAKGTKLMTCGYIERKIAQSGNRRGRKICKLPLTDGNGKLLDVCKKICATVGLGECAE